MNKDMTEINKKLDKLKGVHECCNRNAILDEAIQALKFCDQGEFISVYVRAIEQLKDKDK